MSIDTDLKPVRGDRGYDRYLGGEAGERLVHERDTRLAQLAAIHKAGYTGVDTDVTASRGRAIQLVLDEIEAATRACPTARTASVRTAGNPLPSSG